MLIKTKKCTKYEKKTKTFYIRRWGQHWMWAIGGNALATLGDESEVIKFRRPRWQMQSPPWEPRFMRLYLITPWCNFWLPTEEHLKSVRTKKNKTIGLLCKLHIKISFGLHIYRVFVRNHLDNADDLYDAFYNTSFTKS